LTTRLAWHELAWSDSKNDYGIEIKMATTNAICTYSFNVGCCYVLLYESGVTSPCLRYYSEVALFKCKSASAEFEGSGIPCESYTSLNAPYSVGHWTR
jgi:hypothetical protein